MGVSAMGLGVLQRWEGEGAPRGCQCEIEVVNIGGMLFIEETG